MVIGDYEPIITNPQDWETEIATVPTLAAATDPLVGIRVQKLNESAGLGGFHPGQETSSVPPLKFSGGVLSDFCSKNSKEKKTDLSPCLYGEKRTET